MKKYLITGLAIFLPITITTIIIVYCVNFVTEPFMGLAMKYISKDAKITQILNFPLLLEFVSRITILFILLIFILLIGYVAKKLFFKWVLKKIDSAFEKIPIIRTIFKLSREICSKTLKGKITFFSDTALVPFPKSDTMAYGLIAGKVPAEVREVDPNLKPVFVPTSPHPLSGFLLMYKSSEIQKIGIKTKDLLEVLITCGMSGEKSE